MTFRAEGVGFAPLVTLEDVDSTMAEAARRVAAGETGPLWLLARRQSAGRGRRGRAWAASSDDLAASLLFTPTAYRAGADMAEAATLGYALGLAAADALTAFRPTAAVRLKWPNDVLLGERKTAGVLLEAIGPRLVAGIGVNLATAPSDAELEPGALSAAALAAHMAEPPPTPERFLSALDQAFASRLRAWAAGGFAALRSAWLERAAGLGGPARARLGGAREVTGLFRTVDDEGALVLDTPHGEKRIFAADVHFGARAMTVGAQEANGSDAARH